MRDHQTVGKTPGDAAGIAPVNGLQWMDLVKKAVNDASPETLQGEVNGAGQP